MSASPAPHAVATATRRHRRRRRSLELCNSSGGSRFLAKNILSGFGQHLAKVVALRI